MTTSTPPHWPFVHEWTHPFLHTLERPKFGLSDHSAWLKKSPSSCRTMVLEASLKEIKECMEQVTRNARDSKNAIEEIQRDYSGYIYPAFRLWRILSLVIDQHLCSLRSFISWAGQKLATDKEATEHGKETARKIKKEIAEKRKYSRAYNLRISN